MTLKRNHLNRPLSLQNNKTQTLPSNSINGHTKHPNISTVKVNINNNNTAAFSSSCTEEKSPVGPFSPGSALTKTRSSNNISQWTLLCKNATASTSSLSATSAAVKSQTTVYHNGGDNENGGSATPTPRHTLVNVNATMNSSQLRPPSLMSGTMLTDTPRVIPLAATSLVFLGDCEMSVTPKRNDLGDEVDGATSDISEKLQDNVAIAGMCDNGAANLKVHIGTR